MNRKMTCLAVMIAVCVLAAAGCRRRAAEVAEYRDTIPLPAEPLVYTVRSVGRYGGRFIFGETSNPKTFNAPMANEQSSTDVTDRLFAALIDFNNVTQELGPGLATSWDVGSDHLTWTFHLRKGAAFSDGHPITADDVLFNFQVAYDETLHPSIQDLLKVDGQRLPVASAILRHS